MDRLSGARSDRSREASPTAPSGRQRPRAFRSSDLPSGTDRRPGGGRDRPGPRRSVVGFRCDRGRFAAFLFVLAAWLLAPALPGGGGKAYAQAATGKPSISGTLQVNRELTAGTAGIADDNGLTSATYSYQWLRGDSSSDAGTAISDANTADTYATRSTYGLREADRGKYLRVRVSFNDDDGNPESVTSEAAGPVAAGTALELSVSPSHVWETEGETTLTATVTLPGGARTTETFVLVSAPFYPDEGEGGLR